MAAWIQQLTDDRSILPPWIAADSGHAHKVAAIFTESIRFLFDNLSGKWNLQIFILLVLISEIPTAVVYIHFLSY